MDSARKLRHLLDLAEVAGLDVRAMPAGLGDEPGATARLKGRWVLFLNERAPAEDRATFVADVLARFPVVLEGYLLPEIRQMITSAADQSDELEDGPSRAV